MANTKSAAKRARQTGHRTLQNKRVTSRMKTELKKVRTAITEGGKAAAQSAAAAFSSAIDKAVKTGQIHKNKANRHKAILNKQISGLK